MMYIKDGVVANEKDWRGAVPWHEGDEVPKIFNLVVTLQADGQELELILQALKGSAKEVFDKLPDKS